MKWTKMGAAWVSGRWEVKSDGQMWIVLFDGLDAGCKRVWSAAVAKGVAEVLAAQRVAQAAGEVQA